MNFLYAAIGFVLALGPLIVFHELGHYVVARLCGVKVLRFSVGMGKVVWSRRFGRDGTEWAISALPLGGSSTITFSNVAAGTPSMYTLTSGNGPIRGGEWTLEARTTGGRWGQVDQRRGEAFAWAMQTRPFRIAQPGRYAEYRLRIAAPGRLQLAEVELLAPAATR